MGGGHVAQGGSAAFGTRGREPARAFDYRVVWQGVLRWPNSIGHKTFDVWEMGRPDADGGTAHARAL